MAPRAARRSARLALAGLAAAVGCAAGGRARLPAFGQAAILVGGVEQEAAGDLAERVATGLRRRLARAGLHPAALDGDGDGDGGGPGPARLDGWLRSGWAAPAGERTTAARTASARLRLRLTDAAGQVCWQGEVEAEATRLPARPGPWAATVDQQAVLGAEGELAEALVEAAWADFRAAAAAAR